MADSLIAGIVVHWHAEEDLARLFAAWPDDPRFPLVVVDNGSRRLLAFPARAHTQLLSPAQNLGFAGGANLGARATNAPLLLFLNPDAGPEASALEELAAGFAAHPEAAGLAPRLFGADGRSQHRWQLRPLPRVREIFAQVLFLPGVSGPEEEPAAGTPVAQPAGAALALRRTALEAVGGFDERFWPAWFEDVDLARRLSARGLTLLYWPAARFHHRLGGTVHQLGYGRFLTCYSHNLIRYLAKHHGGGWALLAWGLLLPSLLGRLLFLPLRKPRRAPSRRAAALGLIRAALAAATLWRFPRTLSAEAASKTPQARAR